MYEVGCYDIVKKKQFYLHFNSMYILRKFVIKCKYSKRIQITSKPLRWNE